MATATNQERFEQVQAGLFRIKALVDAQYLAAFTAEAGRSSIGNQVRLRTLELVRLECLSGWRQLFKRTQPARLMAVRGTWACFVERCTGLADAAGGAVSDTEHALLVIAEQSLADCTEAMELIRGMPVPSRAINDQIATHACVSRQFEFGFGVYSWGSKEEAEHNARCTGGELVECIRDGTMLEIPAEAREALGLNSDVV